MATSLISFFKCVAQSQEGQLHRLERIRGGGASFSLLYALFALVEALSKIFLYLLLQNISVFYFWTALLAVFPIINFIIYKATLDRPNNIVRNAFLSSFMPLEFLDKKSSRTRNFLFLYKGIHGILLLGACAFDFYVFQPVLAVEPYHHISILMFYSLVLPAIVTFLASIIFGCV